MKRIGVQHSVPILGDAGTIVRQSATFAVVNFILHPSAFILERYA